MFVAFHAACNAHALYYIYLSVAGLAISYFSTLSHKLNDFRKGGGGLLNTSYILIFSTTLPEIFLILGRIQRNIVINERGSSCNVPLILVRFWWKLSFSQYIFKKFSNIKFPEYLSSERPDLPWRQADTTKLRVASRNFANAPKSACDYDMIWYDIFVNCNWVVTRWQ